MINVLYIENKKELSQQAIDLIEALIRPHEKKKANSYRRWQDKQAYLLGKLLIAKHLEKNGYNSALLKQVSYTVYNRPFIESLKGDFNVSHSGNFVTCAFSNEQKLGIDIEKIQEIELNDFDNILNSADNTIIRNSPDRYLAFFKIWSAKEAILKADGCGLTDDIYKLEINDKEGMFNNKRYYLQELDIDPFYSACIASPSPIEGFAVEKVLYETL
jgi:4'-phosphopantetheinyl transferase